MRKVDTNKLVLVGKVSYSQSWAPKRGKNFTNGRITLVIGEDGESLRVHFGLTVDKNRDDVEHFNKLFKMGRKVAILDGCMGGYDKQGEYQYKVEGRLFDTAISADKVFLNRASLTGTVKHMVKKPNGDHGLILECLYDAKRATPRWRKIQVKVLVPKREDDSPPCKAGDRVFLEGQCQKGQAGTYVEATLFGKIDG